MRKQAVFQGDREGRSYSVRDSRATSLYGRDDPRGRPECVLALLANTSVCLL